VKQRRADFGIAIGSTGTGSQRFEALLCWQRSKNRLRDNDCNDSFLIKTVTANFASIDRYRETQLSTPDVDRQKFKEVHR